MFIYLYTQMNHREKRGKRENIFLYINIYYKKIVIYIFKYKRQKHSYICLYIYMYLFIFM